jgi:hypothetical protein
MIDVPVAQKARAIVRKAEAVGVDIQAFNGNSIYCQYTRISHMSEGSFKFQLRLCELFLDTIQYYHCLI